jgi:uncharacterized protein (TIGR00369 family)
MSTRSRTVTWADPRPSAEAARARSGLDFLRAIATGDLPQPPIAQLMGFRLAEVEKGRAVFAGEPGEHHYNPIGTVHGGLAATLCDSAMSCAVHSALPAGTGYTTLELKVNLVRALTAATGPVRCIGTVLHVGRRIAAAEGRLVDARDTLLAHGTATCLIIASPSP